jgi:hypothetical protein
MTMRTLERVQGVGPCQRWNINRGKSCTCGHHELAQGAADGSQEKKAISRDVFQS